MQTTPYLNFDGDCREAFELYARVLGGTPEIMSHGESPVAGEVPAEWSGRVMHAYLETDGAVLMASDSPPGRHVRPEGLWVSLHVDTPAEAERVFAALSEGGEVTMPLEETFWSPRFGMFRDRFGIPWMINTHPAQPS